MTAELSAYGRLARDPDVRETSSGKAMAFASMAVDVDKREDGQNEKGTLWLNLTAFGKAADILAKLAKGDTLSAMGRVQLNAYTAKDGNRREGIALIVDSIVTAKTSRPQGRPKNDDHQPPAPDDDLPF